ncbi:uncharacterized protein METZ01_LOCUS389554, partial [marine metagenome]
MTTLNLFPNTGHQYYFLKFPSPEGDSSEQAVEGVSSRDELSEDVEQACLRDNGIW